MSTPLNLQEKLAVERTRMAIDRTLLSFVRTALYLIVAGITLHSLLELSYGEWLQWGLIGFGVLTLAVGLYKNHQWRKSIRHSNNHLLKLVLDEEGNEMDS